MFFLLIESQYKFKIDQENLKFDSEAFEVTPITSYFIYTLPS